MAQKNSELHKKLKAFIGLCKRSFMLTDSDVLIYGIETDTVPREIAGKAKKQPSQFLHFGRYIIDLSNVEAGTATMKSVASLVSSLQIFLNHEDIFSQDTQKRMFLPLKVRDYTQKAWGGFAKSVLNEDVSMSILGIGDQVSSAYTESPSDFMRGDMVVGIDDTASRSIYSTALDHTDSVMGEEISRDKIIHAYEDSESDEKHLYIEGINLTREVEMLQGRDPHGSIDSESYYCYTCGDELVYVNDVMAYCENCDKTFEVQCDTDESESNDSAYGMG